MINFDADLHSVLARLSRQHTLLTEACHVADRLCHEWWGPLYFGRWEPTYSAWRGHQL